MSVNFFKSTVILSINSVTYKYGKIIPLMILSLIKFSRNGLKCNNGHFFVLAYADNSLLSI